MANKIYAAQANVSDEAVSKMIFEFQEQFRGIYPDSMFLSAMGAVGPMQAFIGLAIANGHLKLGDTQ